MPSPSRLRRSPRIASLNASDCKAETLPSAHTAGRHSPPQRQRRALSAPSTSREFALSRLQDALHQDEFEPAVELAADFGHASNDVEAELLVEGNRLGVGAV